jgi:hypothetical protein
MPRSRLAALARGPATPPVAQDARASVYVIAREGRGAAAVSRAAPGAPPAVLARSARRLRGPDWAALATAILLDATGRRPPAKLARDLGRFIVASGADERRMSGEELTAWLESWRAPLSGLLPGR